MSFHHQITFKGVRLEKGVALICVKFIFYDFELVLVTAIMKTADCSQLDEVVGL